MRAQHFRAVFLCSQTVHYIVPQRSRGAQLRNLHEEVHANAEEERQSACERINIEARCHRALCIFLAIGNGEGEFLHCGRASFMHMIAADRNAIEFRHVSRGVSDDVRYDPHARLRRIDIGVAHHEFF